MRVWDINPGYLNRRSLLGEHAENHALQSVISHEKRGYRRHPETARWRDHLPALAARHGMLVAEMAFRGIRHQSPCCGSDSRQPAATEWPAVFIDPPARQFELLAAKYAGKESGRIPLPRSTVQLWAQHKYSVLARDPAFYRTIGPALAASPPQISFPALAEKLALLLREPPPDGLLRNALEHMWGYVSAFALAGHRMFRTEEPRYMMHRMQELAQEHCVTYLLESTALTELAVWMA